MVDTGPLVKMDEQDYDMITTTSMEWGTHWLDQAPRFEMMEGEVIDFGWAMGYWVADYPSVILAKNYLMQQDEDFQVYIDTITDDFLIVTNFRTKGWRK